MRCILCESWSFSIICKSCQHNILQPNIHQRKLKSGLKVYSFYDYDDIDDLIKTKKSYFGFYVLNILAKLSFGKFAREWTGIDFKAIPVDDVVSSSGFSHTAILANNLNSQNKKIETMYQTLISTNRVQYFGKSLKFRRANKREFKLTRNINKLNIVLIDDVVTTGSTLIEAEEIIKKNNGKVLFCLTLATTKLNRESK